MNEKSETMTDEFYDEENPPITEERVQKGWVRMPDGSRIVPVKMDAATFQWFRAQGKDFSQQMEAALRTYAASERKHQTTS